MSDAPIPNDIVTGLKKLDLQNDNHWTTDKLPRIETVRILAGRQTINRDEIEATAPGFTRDTAAAYWLTYSEPAQPAASGATGPAGADDQAGQGGSSPPQPQGAGAAPQAETQTGEGAEASTDDAGTDGSGSDTAGAPEQPEVEMPGDGSEDGLEALEAELEETQNALTEKRAVIDQANAEMTPLIAREAELFAEIEARKSKTKPTGNAIQQYLAGQRKLLEERAARKQLIAESGLDLAELATDLKSPIDAAMARRTGRGGQRPTR